MSVQAAAVLTRPAAPRLRSRVIRRRIVTVGPPQHTRQVDLSATAAVGVTGVIVGEAAYTRQVDLAATAAIAVSGQVTTVVLHTATAALSATATIAARPEPPPAQPIEKFPGRYLLVYREGVLLGQLMSITQIGSARKVRNTTRYGATMTTYKLGVKQGDEVSMVFASDPNDVAQDALQGDYLSRLSVTFTVQHPPAGWTITIEGRVTGVWVSAPIYGLYTLTVRVRILSIV